ncbi:MAG: FAD-dependent oxidoreductase [Bacteroidota bacterium]
MKDYDLIIIGAGLSGLTLAYFLRKRGIESLVLEGRSRAGGRIDTLTLPGGTLEMGATWIQPQHRQIIDLASELGLALIPQYTGSKVVYDLPSGVEHYLLPPAAPTYRLEGGTARLIEALQGQLPANCVRYDQKVEHMDFSEKKGVQIRTTSDQFGALKVISSLPPNLLINTLTTDPAWPSALTEAARQTHTWMGESIKVGMEVAKAPWREQEVGMLLSNRGPATELHDHGVTHGGHLLKGFIDPSHASLSPTERRERMLGQLQRLFPSLADASINYHEKVWSQDPFTYYPYHSFVAPHQNNGAGIFRSDFYDGRLRLTGAETAATSPGYMDGAVVRSAQLATELSKETEAHGNLSP